MIKLKAKANWKEFRRDQIGRWYQWGDLRVCVGDPEQEGHHHISISHPYRYPTWDEIYTAREAGNSDGDCQSSGKAARIW